MKRRLTILLAAVYCALNVGCSGKSGDGTGQQNEAVVIRSESLGVDTKAQADSIQKVEAAARQDSIDQANAVNEICDMLAQVNSDDTSKVYAYLSHELADAHRYIVRHHMGEFFIWDAGEGWDYYFHHMEPQSVQILSPTVARALADRYMCNVESDVPEMIGTDTLSIIKEESHWVIDDINNHKKSQFLEIVESHKQIH